MQTSRLVFWCFCVLAKGVQSFLCKYPAWSAIISHLTWFPELAKCSTSVNNSKRIYNLEISQISFGVFSVSYDQLIFYPLLVIPQLWLTYFGLRGFSIEIISFYIVFFCFNLEIEVFSRFELERGVSLQLMSNIFLIT